MISNTVRVKIIVTISETCFESYVYNMRKAVQVVDELCDMNKPPKIFVSVGDSTYQEVALSDFV